MNNWARIQYRDFWDVPRMFVARYEGRVYLFDCAFDDDVEDYPDSYQVYLMPELLESDLAGSWVHLPKLATAHLGETSLDSVTFDPTRRSAIDPEILTRFAAKANGAMSTSNGSTSATHALAPEKIDLR